MNRLERRVAKLEADLLPRPEKRLHRMFLVAGHTPTPKQVGEMADARAQGIEVSTIHLIGKKPRPEQSACAQGSSA